MNANGSRLAGITKELWTQWQQTKDYWRVSKTAESDAKERGPKSQDQPCLPHQQGPGAGQNRRPDRQEKVRAAEANVAGGAQPGGGPGRRRRRLRAIPKGPGGRGGNIDCPGNERKAGVQ